MTQLHSFNQQTNETLKSIQQSIEQLQVQLSELNAKFNDVALVANGQKLLTKDWQMAILPLQSLFEKACGVYKDPEVLDQMVEDVKAMADKAKENFEELMVAPNEYIDGVKDKSAPVLKPTEVVNNDDDFILTVDQVLPDEDDNTTVLTANQIEIVLTPVNEETIKQVRNSFNISAKVTKLSSIASALVKHNLTHSKLKRLIEYIEGQQLLLTGN